MRIVEIPSQIQKRKSKKIFYINQDIHLKKDNNRKKKNKQTKTYITVKKAQNQHYFL